jgi:hypothetical protein
MNVKLTFAEEDPGKVCLVLVLVLKILFPDIWNYGVVYMQDLTPVGDTI